MKWLSRSRSIYPPPPLSFPSNEAFVSEKPSSGCAHLLVKGEPTEESSPFSGHTPYRDVFPPAPVSHDRDVYVTETSQIHDLDHSLRFLKSETHRGMSGGGAPGKNGESDFTRTLGSDVISRDMSVRRPLRPW
jgi:hypothetical protein